ncbi:hypothetical protein K3495_g12328 [Podosphaera aphanis]|nr:hypothetical protein K3495_g12328 [Podosphaera aphanis]
MMAGVNNSRDYIELMGLGHIDIIDGSETPIISNNFLQGAIVSVYYIGTLVGAIFGGWVGEREGRIRTIAIGAAWAIVGAILQSVAMNHTWMICARLVNGFGTGILNAIIPVWATECVPHTGRGQFIAIEFTLNIFGVVVAYWLAFGLSVIGDPSSSFRWRFPIAIQILPLAILFGVVWYFPESPRWLVKVDRKEEARYVLARLRGNEGDAKTGAEVEFQEICSLSYREKQAGTVYSYWSMLTGKGPVHEHIGRRVQLVIWLQIAQEWVGIAGITIYSPIIFRKAGFDSDKSQWISGLNTIFYMFSTLICVFTIDRIGRRWTLYWGSLGQGIAMFIAGAMLRLSINATHAENFIAASKFGAAAASMIFMFTFIFGATWLTVPWLYSAEIFPLEVRAKGNAWGVVGWSIGNCWLTLLCPLMFAHLQEWTLYIFGFANFLTLPMVWALYPESNQRTLEELNLLFTAKTPWVWDAEEEFRRAKMEYPDLDCSPGRRSLLIETE